ncbi:MAG: hypothetical protein COW00_20195 [Bdellovibrio sp. CG12_big_fil_rev_8_21_14_0_65_39_13]|nr:MAG: hypothetical protein COW78_15405 [Bdellovibrio sp. CG22_combo_CG10-13_8_21_14_all_39_27]PIQ57551.1 MAG: hypothetical protein COW00_20195 [Bdellovibrio sp. CG12_big_fil_rev_8_21_14_0_65_39_13]PIR33754.1 MAG: hypothetical protein COV37_15285 [Bdellovibrio sp. CG11_big_fil_rev_8_21_14_0_20_39_38]PJB52702.1 MAG: DUF2452 domain-containing protein [Bdellovibrio sp. CG_4_9_14_3_um_filter_39_7]
MDDLKPKPITISDRELEVMKTKTVDLPGLLEYAHSVGGFAITPSKEGDIKSKAMEAMKEQTQDQLSMLFDQMKLLAKQAQEIKDRVDVSQMIYLAEMKFEPVLGKNYYLYKKDSGGNIISIIGPHEWGKNSSFDKCIAKVCLLHDHTWKILEKYDQED